MNKKEIIENIKNDLEDTNSVLYALSNEFRGKILLVLLDNCTDGGVKVSDIAKKVNLSRPAVSHHLKILKEEGIISVSKVGTSNYYHITGVNKILCLEKLINDIKLYIESED